MKVVVGLCAVLPFTSRLTGPWSLNSVWSHWQHSLQGTRQKWTDLSHHAQLSMCTSRDKTAASRMEFNALIQSEFVAVVSWKVGWLCFFFTTQNLHSSLGCFYPSGTTGRVVSSNTDWVVKSDAEALFLIIFVQVCPYKIKLAYDHLWAIPPDGGFVAQRLITITAGHGWFCCCVWVSIDG